MKAKRKLSREQKQYLNQSNEVDLHELLKMSNSELNAFLQNEYLENPLIEQSTLRGGQVLANYNPIKILNARSEQNKDTQDIETYLMEQLKGDYSKEEQKLIHFLINSLDDNGFFSMKIADVAKITGVEKDTIKKCLEDLRQLEPFGIFSKNLSQCLMRQIEVLGVEDEKLQTIIKNYLEDISNGNISTITRTLKISSAQVKKYIAFIMTLNPRPLSGFSVEEDENKYIVPDVIFNKKDDSWNIRINDEWIGNYQLNDYYLKMMRETSDEELKKYFNEKLERAKSVLNSVAQRKKTILDISTVILDLQKQYFEDKQSMDKMTTDDIAKKLGIHKTVVSKAIKDKYIQYPGGSVMMEKLFIES